jgi:hypothetical protein
LLRTQETLIQNEENRDNQSINLKSWNLTSTKRSRKW